MLMKKIILGVALVSALGFATAATASDPGFYLGAQGGYGNTHQNGVNNAYLNTAINAINSSGLTTASSGTSTNNTGGFAGGLFGGYQFDSNWALEASYKMFAYANGNQYYNANFIGGGSTALSERLRTKTNLTDVVVKGILPIENGFSAYAKAGLAYVNERQTVTNNVSVVVPQIGLNVNQTGSSNPSDHRILPTATLGVQYDITPELSADVSWEHVQTTGHTHFIRNIDFAGVGLAYHFG